jgi:hypothetical protein
MVILGDIAEVCLLISAAGVSTLTPAITET